MIFIQEEVFSKLDLILDANNYDSEKLIPILQQIQGKFGYLSEENLKYISNRLKITLSRVYGVATFYTQFKMQPQGKYQIQACRGTACTVKGGERLFNYMKTKLGINEDETTSDGIFTLAAVNCVGACAIAPVMVINGETYGHLDLAKIDKILDECRQKCREN